jgi:hypothetical protein
MLAMVAGQPSSGHRIRRQCSKRRGYGKPLTGILRLLDGKNARPSEHPFSAALIETRRKIARAAEQSALTEVFGFPIPTAPRFIAPEHRVGRRQRPLLTR